MAQKRHESPHLTAAPAHGLRRGAAALLPCKSEVKDTAPMNQTALLEAVAAAALAWNRARLTRIEVARRVPDWRHPQHAMASRTLDNARKAEAQAKARLRKACAAADPASRTLDVEACEVIEAVTLPHWEGAG